MSTPTQFRVFLFKTSGRIDWQTTIRLAPVGVEFTMADFLRNAPESATNASPQHARRVAAMMVGQRWGHTGTTARELRRVAHGLYIVDVVPSTATRPRS